MSAAGRGCRRRRRAAAVATWAPTPLIARSVGAVLAVSSSSWASSSTSSSFKVLPAASQRAQREPGGLERCVRAWRRRNSAASATIVGGRPADEASAELLGGGVDDGVDLVAGLRAGLHRRAAGDPQQPDRFDLTGLGLRGADRFAGEHGTGGADGVGLVGLAVAAAVLTVRAHHLTHIDTLRGEVSGPGRHPTTRCPRPRRRRRRRS